MLRLKRVRKLLGIDGAERPTVLADLHLHAHRKRRDPLAERLSLLPRKLLLVLCGILLLAQNRHVRARRLHRQLFRNQIIARKAVARLNDLILLTGSLNILK